MEVPSGKETGELDATRQQSSTMSFVLCIVLVYACTCFGQPSPVVSVTGGQVRGVALDVGAVFKGIPYAQPPLADLRWRKPAPIKPWTGVRDAVQFGGACAMNPIWGMPKVVNEDCLYINVWTPTLPPTTLKPVMVWIHGGANVAGSGNENGENLMRHGVVVVSFNYRLGPFGFFAHPALVAETRDRTAGNYGLMDQIAALQWVQENIKKFGGDPTSVTIFGESAGAIVSNLLMTSPLAKGLFKRVICESGTLLLENGGQSLSAEEQFGVKLAETVKLPSDARPLQGLRSASVEQLLEAFAKVVGPSGVPPDLGVTVDGYVLTRPPAEVFASGKQIPAAMIAGINARELFGPPKAADVKKAIATKYGTLAAQAFPLYGISTASDGFVTQAPASPLYGDAGAQWMTDTVFRCPAVQIAGWNSRSGHPTYQYQFNRGVPGHPEIGAIHASEVTYVFGNLDEPRPYRPNYEDADQAISKAMQDYWTNFAKTGDPNSSWLPAWPQYQTTTKKYLEFTDNGPAVAADLRSTQCKVYSENLEKQMAGASGGGQ
jgi:para-nitrobenzyl esterase